MIIIKMWGGLCNQMFQYAFGYALSKKENDIVYFDTMFYNKQPKYVDKRQIEIIDAFDLDNLEIAGRPHGVNLFQNMVVSNIARRITGFHVNLPGDIVYVKEKRREYNDNLFYSSKKINYYDGYWQTETYFLECADEIRKQFSFSEKTSEKCEKWLKSFGSNNLVAMHVRRGDMRKKKSKGAEISDISYFRAAMHCINSKLNNAVFVVFSDDINWCKYSFENLGERIVFQEEKWTSYEDLCAISLCNHGIMSKSTFSWWGNWLAANPNRIVIAPKGLYFNNRFIPERWLQM